MVSLDKAVVARLVVQGEHFEVLVDPNVIDDIKANPEFDVLSALAIDAIFKDQSKGEHASEETLTKIFETTEVSKVAREIIERGDIQLTTEQRKEMQESKRRQIITAIVRNAINPQTKTPHPPQRIELALKEAKVHIDPFKPVDVQVQDILVALEPIIPIRFEKVVMAVKLAADDYGKCYGDIKSFGKITKEEWQKDGSWIGLVELPAGLQIEFFDKLNARTKGQTEIKLIE
ncbi:MAG: ribosome assembly factor SBDS [Thermoplasmata archaeon]|nr:ribosome assembly factor SBDS [Thermoplasmata archaeon]